MVKVVFGWKDAPTKPGQESEDHYRSHHMELARQAYTGVEGFRLLVFNRVRRARVNDFNSPVSREVEPPMDSFIELYFDSMEQLLASQNQPILKEMFEDHANFMNCDIEANVVIYEVDEEVILRGPSE